MKHRKVILLSLAAVLAFACTIPVSVVSTGTPAAATPTFVLFTPTATPIGSTIPFAWPNDGPLNCRSGPSTNFQVVIVLSPIQSAEVVGKNPEGTWWYVKNPSLAGNYCWVSADFADITGDASAIGIVALPATPTPAPNSGSVVIAIEMFIEPDTIQVSGCNSPGQALTVSAKIQTNGPMQIKAHFRDEQSGDLSTHVLNFTRADIQEISDTFTPLVNEGRHRIFLVIEGLDLSGLNALKPYKINC